MITKNKYLTCIIVVLLPLLMSFAPNWIKFTSDKNEFSVDVPVKPEESEQKIPSAIGELSLKIYTSQIGEKEIYMVMSTDYPKSANINSDAKESLPGIFRGAIDGGVKNVGGTLLSEKEINIKGYPGREYKISFQNGEGVISARVYIVKSRMYIIQALVATGENSSSVSKFLDSFDLTGR